MPGNVCRQGNSCHIVVSCHLLIFFLEAPIRRGAAGLQDADFVGAEERPSRRWLGVGRGREDVGSSPGPVSARGHGLGDGSGRNTAWSARGLVSARGHGLGGSARRPVCRSRARSVGSGGDSRLAFRPPSRIRPPGRVGAARSIRAGPGGLPARRGRGSYSRRGPGVSERQGRAPRVLAGRLRAAGCRGEVAYCVFAPARARGPSRASVIPPGGPCPLGTTAPVGALGRHRAARVRVGWAREAVAFGLPAAFADPGPRAGWERPVRSVRVREDSLGAAATVRGAAFAWPRPPGSWRLA